MKPYVVATLIVLTGTAIAYLGAHFFPAIPPMAAYFFGGMVGTSAVGIGTTL